jgi:hypothetical protein
MIGRAQQPNYFWLIHCQNHAYLPLGIIMHQFSDFVRWNIWAIFLIAAAAIQLSSFADGHEWGADYTWNWAQAVSLIDGSAAELARAGDWRVANMPDLIVGPPVYPWGFSVILAAGHLAWGHDVNAMKIFMLAFYFSGFAVFALIAKDRIGPFGTAALVATLALLPSLFIEKNHIRSEAPFLLFFMLATYVMCRIYDERNRPSAWQLGLLGLLIFAAYWTRTHGLTMLGALVLIQTLQRRFNAAPFLAFGACWAAIQLFPGTTSYLGSGHADGLIAAPVQTVWRNAVYYLYAPGDFFDAPKIARPIIGLAFYGLIAAGAWRRRKADIVIILVCATYIALIVPYPYRQPRFLFPILPFLLYFAYHGLTWTAAQRAVAGATAALCLAVTIAKWSGEQPTIEGPYSSEAKALWQYVKTTPADTVFLFWKPRSLTFYGDRRAIMRSDTPCPAARVVVYRNPDQPGVRKRNDRLAEFAKGAPVFENGKFSVFKTTTCKRPSD